MNYSHYRKKIYLNSNSIFYLSHTKTHFIKMKRGVMFLYGIGFNDLDHGKSTKEKE